MVGYRIGFAVVLVLLTAWQTHAQDYNCTAAGRFADTDDPTCQNYTLCALDATTNTYVSYNYTCPTTSVFNPNTAQCTDPENYNCTNTETNTTSVCTEDGFIADTTSTDCSTYIQCVEINGTFSETTLTCPDSTYFDPSTTLCDPSYNCTTTSTDFTCTTAGRFANTTDTTCQTYIMCVQATNGTFYEYDYTCPSTSVFNPNTALCTADYTCTN